MFWWLVFGWFPSANTIIDLNWTYVVHRDVVMFLTLPPLAPIIFSAKGSTISLTEPGLHAPNEDLQIKPRDFTPKGSEDPILLSSGIISVIQKEKKTPKCRGAALLPLQKSSSSFLPQISRNQKAPPKFPTSFSRPGTLLGEVI